MAPGHNSTAPAFLMDTQPAVFDHIIRQQEEIERITAKLEAAEKDAARYQYAQKYLFIGIVGPEGGQTSWFDKQIDTAIKGQQ